MYCNICGSREKSSSIFALNICKTCLSEIEDLNIEDENYDYYKNIIRIFWGHYINTPLVINSVN